MHLNAQIHYKGKRWGEGGVGVGGSLCEKVPRDVQTIVLMADIHVSASL